jgi:hypothetical protein
MLEKKIDFAHSIAWVHLVNTLNNLKQVFQIITKLISTILIVYLS